MNRHIKKLGVIGLGLLGGIVIRQARQYLSVEIVCLSRDEDLLKQVKSMGLIDDYTLEDYSIFSDCDVVVLCTPVDVILEQMNYLVNLDLFRGVVTDVGSVKRQIVQQAQDLNLSFVGSHPMVGSEKRGFDQSQFVESDGAVCWVTSEPSCSEDLVSLIQYFWKSIGFSVALVSAEEHDRMMARVSHFPHILSAVLSTVLTQKERRMGGQGLKGMLRLSMGYENIWTPIIFENKDLLLDIIGDCVDCLEMLKLALKDHDQDQLRQFLQNSRNKNE